MFSSTRLHAFVCLALGVSVIAAPTGAPGADVEARSPDVYDLSGDDGVAGAGGYYYDPQTGNYYPYYPYGDNQGENGDEDVYILKRQVPDLAIGSQLGVQHASELGAAALDLAGAVGVDADTPVDKRAPDVYDLSDDGGLAAYYGYPCGNGGYNGDGDDDAYVLKREGGDVEARSPDTYDLSGDGASSYGCYGYPYGTGEQGDEDSDTYILKRQIPGLDLASGFGAGAGLGSTGSGLSGLGGSSTAMTSESTSTSTDTSSDGTTASSFGTGSGLDFDNILSGLGANAGANGNLASSLGV